MIRPIGKRLVVAPIEEKRASGIIFKEDIKTEKGKLIAVGNEVSDLVRGSDILYYDKFAGTPMQMGGEDYLILKESEVIAYE